MSDSKFPIEKGTPKPGSTPSSSGQPTGMKSDSQLHREAVDEDNGKC